MDHPGASDRASESLRPDAGVATTSKEKTLKIACTECRRQKVKCDGQMPCERCTRVKNVCQIVPPMKRVSKRKTTETTQISLPKRRLEMAPSTSKDHRDGGSLLISHMPVIPTSIGPNNAMDVQNMADSHSQSSEAAIIPQNQKITMQAGPEKAINTGQRTALEELGMAAEIVSGDVQIRIEAAGNANYANPSPRTLDGLHIDSRAIEDVFQLYFLHYSPILPILDPTIHPDAYHAQLPFLFWCIVAVGSRRYHRDPTIFHSVATRVTESAPMNITAGPINVATIQALLILLTWGSWDKLSSKSTYPLSGFLVHLSMHMGLHNPLSGHDFLSMRKNLSDEEKSKRRELWAHCVLVYQRSCLRIGFAPLNVPRPKLPLGVQKYLNSTSSENLAFDLDFESSLHDLMAKASAALTENGLRNESVHQERGMCIILKIFEDQITDLEARSAPLEGMDKVYLSISKLMLFSVYLFQSPENIDLTCLTRIYVAASNMIDLLDTLDKTSNIVSNSTTYLILGTILAGVILLRFLKGSFAKYLDYEACKTSFLTSVTLLKKSSVENNDGPARFAGRLLYIWTSVDMFRMPNGSRNEELRVRSRLAMSVVYDFLWWAQDDAEKCAHKPPYTDGLLPNTGGNGVVPQNSGLQEQTAAIASSPGPFVYNSFFDEDIPFDLGWALSDDVLFDSWQPGLGFDG